jgi:hypothetical protein
MKLPLEVSLVSALVESRAASGVKNDVPRPGRREKARVTRRRIVESRAALTERDTPPQRSSRWPAASVSPCRPCTSPSVPRETCCTRSVSTWCTGPTTCPSDVMVAGRGGCARRCHGRRRSGPEHDGTGGTVIADPAGRRLWISLTLTGARHDLGAAREHGIIERASDRAGWLGPSPKRPSRPTPILHGPPHRPRTGVARSACGAPPLGRSTPGVRPGRR